MKNVGWIGAGVMGKEMAGHLVKNGYNVKVYNRTYSRALSLEKEKGVKACKTIKEAVEDANYIFTMVGYPKDVEEVYLSKNGILDNAKEGTLIIDMTTSSPALAEKLYVEGKKRGLRIMDAPVSGGDTGAQKGTLAIMVGGDAEDFKEIMPLLQCMGNNITYLGKAGFGQHTKAANQIVVAGNTAAYTEALIYSRKVGLDSKKMLNAISGGAAGSWQLDNMAPRALEEDFAPGFFIKHFVKDMNIVKKEMDDRNISLEILNTVLKMYNDMVEKGFENDGTQALIKIYNDSK